MAWIVEARVADASLGLGLGGHLYLEFWDPSGSLVAQINGMARNPFANEISFVGQDDWPTESVITSSALISGSANLRTDVTNTGVVLFDGQGADFDMLLGYAIEASKYLTVQQLPYQAIPDSVHFNSNSVFNTIANAMLQTGLFGVDTFDAAKITLDAEFFPAGTPGNNKDMFQGDAWAPNFDGNGNIIGSIVTLTESSSTENLNGASGDDILTGDADTNSIAGNAGDDLILGSNGDDFIDGGSGVDVVDYSGLESLFGYNVLADLGAGTVLVDQLLFGTDSTQQLSNIEHVITGDGFDALTAGDTGNHLEAGGGTAEYVSLCLDYVNDNVRQNQLVA